MKKLIQSSFCCALLVALGLGGCGPEAPSVVVYTALDQEFAEPLFAAFEKRHRIKVKARFDTESTKTVGLVSKLMAERDRPRCDVFWNNEIMHTLRLKREGLLEPFSSATTQAFPENFRDLEQHWTGFAARARILIVNTELLPEEDFPTSIHDLADPAWKGRTGIAKPLFGTTATHVACLWAALGEEPTRAWLDALRANDIQIMSGNKDVASAVASGRLAFGLTDTDDAIIEVEAGKPVRIVYPDSDAGQMGTLFLPNTLALIRGGPHPEAARKLIDFLLANEDRLAAGPSAQIPLHPESTAPTRVQTPAQVHAMKVSFAYAAEQYEAAADYVEQHFLD